MSDGRQYHGSMLMDREDVAMERKLAGSYPLPPGHQISWGALTSFNLEQWMQQQEQNDGKRLHLE